MAAGEESPSGADDVLDPLDAAADHILKARALFMCLPPEEREHLRPLTDVLLTAVGRRIAANLSPSVAQSLLRADAAPRACDPT